LEAFTTKAVFDTSLFVDIRKRLGGREFEKLNRHIIEESERLKTHQARVKRKGKPAGETRQNEPEDNQQDDPETNTGEQKNKGTLKVSNTTLH
jgi:hypothetical protein